LTATNLARCPACPDFITLTGTPEQRAEDAAWFAAKHKRLHETPPQMADRNATKQPTRTRA
jgi:hypothetical protein